MVNFDSPAALGLLGEGGVGMGISMSGMGLGLGMTASAMGRADEDERRRRLETIVATLKKKPGRVSEEGILRLCKQENLEVMPEGPPSARTLVLLIGTEAICEIPVRHGEVVVEEVKLALNTDRHNYGETGSLVLQNSLRPLPGMNKINLSLGRFAHNLDKLLRMDNLSAPEKGGVSCYQAIFGVYTSLKKLFDHEKKIAKALFDANTLYSDLKAEREVLCKKGGRPRINAGSCLGLSLEYWMDRRHLIPLTTIQPQSQPSKGKDKMEIDSTNKSNYPEDRDSETNKIYSLTIECESSPATMYSPIRISDSWLSDAIEKAPDAADTDINNILLDRPTIDWLEPPPTYLPSSAADGDHDAMNLDVGPGRLPNIRFVAKFNPPLTIPLSVYVNILQSVGLEASHADFRPTTFVGLALRPQDPDPGLTGTVGESTQEIRAENRILTVDDDGLEKHCTHTTSLYVPKIEYSRTIDALPFQHPRQLVEILPILRQYAFTTSILQHTFGAKPGTKPGEATDSETDKNTSFDPPSPPLTPNHISSADTTTTIPSEPPLQIDLTLAYSPPAPRLRIDIPFPTPLPSSLPSLPQSPTSLLDALLNNTTLHAPLTLTLDVGANAELVIAEQNVVDVLDGKRKDLSAADVQMADAAPGLDDRVKRVARALDVCGDVGVWAEWVRREAGRGG